MKKPKAKSPPPWFQRLARGDRYVSLVVVSPVVPSAASRTPPGIVPPVYAAEDARDLLQLFDFLSNRQQTLKGISK